MDPPLNAQELMNDLPWYATIALEDTWQPDAGCDVLSVVVWIMCTDRGFLASKFAAECIAGNHDPSMVLEKMRGWLVKYFTPGWRGWLAGLRVA